MKFSFKNLMLTLAGLFYLTSCGGANTPSTSRNLTGTLSPSASASKLMSSSFAASSSTDCQANEVIATNALAQTKTAAVDDSCAFSLTLTIGESYVISFLQNDVFVATLIFNSGTSGFSSSVIPVSSGSGDISLGTVTISGNVASPSSNPLSQIDQDGDGISDSDDDDDDNDGVSDDDEGDCDLDGYADDYDDDESECDDDSDGTEAAKIVKVKPYNGNNEVDLDKDVRLRAACILDQTSVTSESFQVVSEDGDEISCSYQFSDEGKTVKCKHDDSPFQADTSYTVTTSGLLCQDESPIPDISFSFSTEAEDDDDSSFEDDEDDNDENGDD